MVSGCPHHRILYTLPNFLKLSWHHDWGSVCGKTRRELKDGHMAVSLCSRLSIPSRLYDKVKSSITSCHRCPRGQDYTRGLGHRHRRHHRKSDVTHQLQSLAVGCWKIPMLGIWDASSLPGNLAGKENSMFEIFAGRISVVVQTIL